MTPGGQEVGVRIPGAGDKIRTVSPGDFARLETELMNGAKPVTTPGGYGGQWFERLDGTVFGSRQSTSGPTIDIIKSNDSLLTPGYKVHSK